MSGLVAAFGIGLPAMLGEVWSLTTVPLTAMSPSIVISPSASAIRLRRSANVTSRVSLVPPGMPCRIVQQARCCPPQSSSNCN